jgi:hypothetical protein
MGWHLLGKGVIIVQVQRQPLIDALESDGDKTNGIVKKDGSTDHHFRIHPFSQTAYTAVSCTLEFCWKSHPWSIMLLKL